MGVPRPICGYTERGWTASFGVEDRVCDRVAIHRGVRDVPRCEGHKDAPHATPCPRCVKDKASPQCPACWGAGEVVYERDPDTGETRRKRWMY